MYTTSLTNKNKQNAFKEIASFYILMFCIYVQKTKQLEKKTNLLLASFTSC